MFIHTTCGVKYVVAHYKTIKNKKLNSPKSLCIGNKRDKLNRKKTEGDSAQRTQRTHNASYTRNDIKANSSKEIK